MCVREYMCVRENVCVKGCVRVCKRLCDIARVRQQTPPVPKANSLPIHQQLQQQMEPVYSGTVYIINNTLTNASETNEKNCLN